MSLSSLPNTSEPDLREDMKVLEDCLLQASTLRGGLWPLFVVLAWVATRDEKFVAATQLYVTRCYADRGSLFSFAAWLCLGRAAEARGGIGFEAAVDQLHEALEAGRLDGGQARSIVTDESALVPRYRWADWDANYANFGIVLIPGFYDFRWPSEAVRQCFPVAVTALERVSAVARPAVPTRTARKRHIKPGPKKRPAKIANALLPLFKRYHDLLVPMGKQGKHKFLSSFWVGSDPSLPAPNTIEAYWKRYLEQKE